MFDMQFFKVLDTYVILNQFLPKDLIKIILSYSRARLPYEIKYDYTKLKRCLRHYKNGKQCKNREYCKGNDYCLIHNNYNSKYMCL